MIYLEKPCLQSALRIEAAPRKSLMQFDLQQSGHAARGRFMMTWLEPRGAPLGELLVDIEMIRRSYIRSVSKYDSVLGYYIGLYPLT